MKPAKLFCLLRGATLTAVRGMAPTQYEAAKHQVALVSTLTASAAAANATLGTASGALLSVGKAECDKCGGIIDYPALIASSSLGNCAVPAMLVWVVTLLWLLNSTAQEFFVPPLVYWSRLLRLPPAVAGATLVSLGNGAPDLFSVIGAMEVGDASLGLTTLLGAMMSGTCIVASAMLLLHGRMRRSSGKLFEKDGEALVPEGVGKASTCEDPNTGPLCASDYVVSATGLALALLLVAFILRRGAVTTWQAASLPLLYGVYLLLLLAHDWGSALDSPSMPPPGGAAPPLAGLERPAGPVSLQTMTWAVLWPSYVLRWAIIPPADLYWDRSRRIVSAMSPVCFTGFCALSYFGGLGALVSSNAAVAALVLSIVASVLVVCFSDDGPSVPCFYPALTLLAKASSILVLSVIAGELTACVETLGWLGGVPRLWLGTTVLAWGNSIGDVFTGLAMVRQGQVKVAFTAVFASPLFNLLCSAGLALAFLASSAGGSATVLKTRKGILSLQIHVMFLVTSVLVLGLAVLPYCRGWRGWPPLLWVLYCSFLTCALLSAEG